MESNKPPIRTISPGRVLEMKPYLLEHIVFFIKLRDYILLKMSFSDLKQTLKYFTESLFGNSNIRLRPSYFPFTEPSAEVDIFGV